MEFLIGVVVGLLLSLPSIFLFLYLIGDNVVIDLINSVHRFKK